MDDPGFFRDLKVMEGSQKVIRELSKYYEIYITTAAMEILFTAPHNVNESGYVRVNNWYEVGDYFLSDNKQTTQDS